MTRHAKWPHIIAVLFGGLFRRAAHDTCAVIMKTLTITLNAQRPGTEGGYVRAWREGGV